MRPPVKVPGAAPRARATHAPPHFLRHKECATGVGVKDEVVVLGRHIEQALGGADPGVVDQDIDRSDLGFPHGRPLP